MMLSFLRSSAGKVNAASVGSKGGAKLTKYLTNIHRRHFDMVI